MASKAPPIPPEQRPHVAGPGRRDAHADLRSAGRSNHEEQNLREQGRHGNINQNTHHQGYQQDR
jgi:hypothetical protein